MINHISINHLAVVEHLDLAFKSGMTVLTGETGAGKSILIDALGLTLGERADSSVVRQGQNQAEVSVSYDITHLSEVNLWLKEHALDSEDECIIRRSISQDGRSRAYINGRTVPLAQLKDIAQLLIDIHGQHQHQSLLRTEHQRRLLDEYANHPKLLTQVNTDYVTLQAFKKEYKELLSYKDQSDKLNLLQYQIQEIDELSLQDNELQNLEQEHKTLAHSEQWLSACELALNALKSETGEDAFSAIHHALAQVNNLKATSKKLDTTLELLNNALIQLDEATQELENFKDSLNRDPNRLQWVDQRLSQIHTLARKHRIQPEHILDHQNNLKEEASKLLHLQHNLETIQNKIKDAKEQYLTSAKKLSDSRKKTAQELEKQVTKRLQQLEMPNGHFKIAFTDKAEDIFTSTGIDEIEFLVTTNPGLPLQPLRKIASGGELSRISLSIQVITAQKMTVPTLIFDEVDTGISGKTAETVGKLLRELSSSTQVLCVTHLAQIASLGHNHFKVQKNQTKTTTATQIIALSGDERVHELARMLGGANITKHAIAHAQEMLENV